MLFAAPEPPAIESVRWTAPAECPGEAELEARIVEALGPEPVPLPKVDANVRATETGFRLVLAVDDGHGGWTRTLDAGGCTVLADSAALLVVVAARATTHARVPEPEAIAETTTKVVIAEPIATPPPVRRSLRPRGTAATQLRVGPGGLPAVGVGLEAALGLDWTHVRIEAFGDAWIDRRREAHDTTTQMRMFAFGGRACGKIGKRVVVPVLCGESEGGWIRAFAPGTDGAHRPVRPWAASAISAGLEWWVVPQVALTVGGRLTVPWFRDRWRVGDALVFETPVVTGDASVGVRGRWGGPK